MCALMCSACRPQFWMAWIRMVWGSGLWLCCLLVRLRAVDRLYIVNHQTEPLWWALHLVVVTYAERLGWPVVDPRQQLRVREDGVRGMFASADIDAGDLLAWLPYDRLLSSEGQTKSASYCGLKHRLRKELTLGGTSKWEPYLETLKNMSFAEHPEVWSIKALVLVARIPPYQVRPKTRGWQQMYREAKRVRRQAALHALASEQMVRIVASECSASAAAGESVPTTATSVSSRTNDSASTRVRACC